MGFRLRALGLVVAATSVLLPVVQPARAADEPARCAGPPSADEWPTFGRDLANTRRQEDAGAISATTAPLLEPVWSWTSGAAFAGIADLNGTPIVSGGCTFVNTAGGIVAAVDTATGEEVWRRTIPLDPGTVAGLGGIFVSSPAVHDGLVLALVNQVDAPYVLALSAADGTTVWRSEPMADGSGYYTNATPVVVPFADHAPIVLAGFSPSEGDPTKRGGIAIHDATTGALLERVWAIPDEDFAEGYAGGGIWTAPAVDADGYAYAGTSNPYSKQLEHANTNAILKVDVDPRRDTFGDVVGSFKGIIEQVDPLVRDAIDPVCESIGEDPNLQLIVGNSAPCLQLDLDFGTPPTLFTDSTGVPIVGELQKAGVLHAVRTADMTEAWTATVGVSCAACNAAAWGFDGERLVGGSSPVGTMVSVGRDDGVPAWASPIADGTHYQSTSIAGGVVFTVDNAGVLHGWDAATGLVLLKRPVQADLAPDGVAVAAGLSSSGIAVAGGMVIVATGNSVVAYRPVSVG